MEQSKKIVVAFWSAVAARAAVVFVTAVTVLGEFSPNVKDQLKALFTHHWIGKGVLAALMYLVVLGIGLLVKKTATEAMVAKAMRQTAWLSAVATVGLFLFFAYESTQ
jgi:accessory gene regulator protein AgrB